MKLKFAVKIGILTFMLIVPIFVFLFLKFFGENHYQVRTYFPIDLQTKIDSNNQLTRDTIYYSIPDLIYKDQSGSQKSILANKNKLLVLNFFFTRCPGICPKMMSNLNKVQETFLKDTSVKIISISVDPQFDTPEILAQYASKYRIVNQKWDLAFAEKNDVYTFGFNGLKLPADTIDKTLHSEKLVLVDRNFNIRGYYAGTKNKEVERLVTEIKIIQTNR